MGKKPLTEEQRKAKQERDRARRAKAKATKGPKPTKPAKGEKVEQPRGKEVDLSRVAADKAKGMLLKVHKLEKGVEAARAKFDRASQARRAAKANLEKAQDALNREIQDQRFGPGPLFAKDGNPDLEPAAAATA